MFNNLRSLFSSEEPVDYKEKVNEGALLLDVRTPGEFRNGNIKGSKNIPLQNLRNEMDSLDKEKPVIVFCASGSRSSSAKRMLESNGFEEVHNGGGWQMLQHQLI
jgi:rhodanese-related sulfurtransferase